MTIDDILEQAQALTPAERQELAERLLAMPVQAEQTTTSHWGKSLNQLMDEIGSIEMKYPEIEDPVEWVKQIRLDMKVCHHKTML